MAPPRRSAPRSKLILAKFCQIDNRWSQFYTWGVRKFQLPEKVKVLLVPGVCLLVALLLVGGFYFHRRSVFFSSQNVTGGEGGVVSGVRSGLPEDFPDDVPLFEPAEILSSLSSRERMQVTLQTTTVAARVRDFYQQKMGGAGWQLTGQAATGEPGVLTFLKGGRQTQLTITSNPDGSTLIILNTAP